MAWFHEWWIGLGLVGQMMACAAIPMTIVLFLQALLMVLGAGFGGGSDSGVEIDDGGGDAASGSGGTGDIDGSAGADSAGMDANVAGGSNVSISDAVGEAAVHGADAASVSPHEPTSHHDAARIFTIRGIVAFFAMGGWAGIAALSVGVHSLISISIALVVGAMAMMLASSLINFALRMQQSGNISLANAVAGTADVYITIPPERSGIGKVTMTLQERFVELDAVTDSGEALKPNTKVEVTGIDGKDCVVVEPLEK
jgi:hypothetical protein